MKVWSLFLVVSLFTFSIDSAAHSQEVYECVFIDAETGDRIEGVELIIYLSARKGVKKFISNENGTIRFEIVSPLSKGNSYNISFSKSGYVSPSGYLRLSEPFRMKYQIHKLPDNIPVANVIQSVDEQTVQVIEPITHVLTNEYIVKDEEIPKTKLLDGFATNNFVFLIDVSNSMEEDNRLNVLKESLNYLVKQFRDSDQVAVVAYSSAARVVLNSTRAREADKIIRAVNSLETAGATKGGLGLELAYEIAQKNFLKDGNNKIILATDGAFTSTKRELKDIRNMIRDATDDEIKLSVFSFGPVDDDLMKNMQEMSSAGKGHYAHISSVQDGQIALIREAQGKKIK